MNSIAKQNTQAIDQFFTADKSIESQKVDFSKLLLRLQSLYFCQDVDIDVDVKEDVAFQIERLHDLVNDIQPACKT